MSDDILTNRAEICQGGLEANPESQRLAFFSMIPPRFAATTSRRDFRGH